MNITAYRDREKFSEHVIAIERGPRTLEIQEIINFVTDPHALTTCIMTVRTEGYTTIDMQIKRATSQSSLQIDVSTDHLVTVKMNGLLTHMLAHTIAGPVLFDGPSPMFDWTNAIMIIGMRDGEEIHIPVYVIDWRVGRLITSEYKFKRRGNRIAINKGLDVLSDSEIAMAETSEVGDIYYSGGYSYLFQGAREAWR